MRQAFTESMLALASANQRVVFLGSDLGNGAMREFQAAYPNRFLMEGVAEQYVIGMAAGLATTGCIPYVQSIATFITRRAFEQVFVDLGLQRLPVRIVGSGGGLVYSALGPTHTALEDVGLLRLVPNLAICIPRNSSELRQLLSATADLDGPLYIRLSHLEADDEDCALVQFGEALTLRRGRGTLIVSTGVTSSEVLRQTSSLISGGLDPEILHFPTIRPFDAERLCEAACRSVNVVVVEEHNRDGGLGSIVLEVLADAKIMRATTRIGVKSNSTLAFGNYAESRTSHALRGSALANAILAAGIYPVR